MGTCSGLESAVSCRPQSWQAGALTFADGVGQGQAGGQACSALIQAAQAERVLALPGTDAPGVGPGLAGVQDGSHLHLLACKAVPRGV